MVWVGVSVLRILYGTEGFGCVCTENSELDRGYGGVSVLRILNGMGALGGACNWQPGAFQILY